MTWWTDQYNQEGGCGCAMVGWGGCGGLGWCGWGGVVWLGLEALMGGK